MIVKRDENDHKKSYYERVCNYRQKGCVKTIVPRSSKGLSK